MTAVAEITEHFPLLVPGFRFLQHSLFGLTFSGLGSLPEGEFFNKIKAKSFQWFSEL